jgi:hypothetical protein
MHRIRLFSVVFTLVFFAATAVAYVQVITGHVAVYKLGVANADVVEYSTDVGEETVEIRVENPTQREFTVKSVLVHGYVGEKAINQDGRIVLDEAVTVPPNANETLTVSLTVPEERRELSHEGGLVFEGNLGVEMGAERELIELGPSEVDT